MTKIKQYLMMLLVIGTVICSMGCISYNPSHENGSNNTSNIIQDDNQNDHNTIYLFVWNTADDHVPYHESYETSGVPSSRYNEPTYNEIPEVTDTVSYNDFYSSDDNYYDDSGYQSSTSYNDFYDTDSTYSDSTSYGDFYSDSGSGSYSSDY